MKITMFGLYALAAVYLISSCSDNKKVTVDPILSVKDSVSRIDSLFKTPNPKRLKVFIKTKENQFVEIKDTNKFPENVLETINLCYNDSGKLVGYKYIPASESGDYFNIITYYFNGTGNTIAYKTHSSFFGEDCSLEDRIITETEIIYFDRAFKVLKKEYSLLDENKNPVDAKNCVFNYRIDGKPYKSIALNPVLKQLNIN